jgi:hypothetical protein
VNDLEHVLGPRLHDLADQMAGPDPVVPAADAIARHGRQRRARAGMAALAVVVALVAVGVPTGMSLLGAGHGATAGTPARTSTPPAEVTAGPSAAESSAAESAAQEALGKAVLQQLIAQRVTEPLRLTAPATWGDCPPATVLTTASGTPWSYWQGHLPGGPDGCEYLAGDGPPGTSTQESQEWPETQEWVSVGFLTGTTTEQMNAGVAASDSSSGDTCVSTNVSQNGLLQRCQGPAALHYVITVPDTGGKGIWVLSVFTGDRYDGDPGMALQAVTAMAQKTFGH